MRAGSLPSGDDDAIEVPVMLGIALDRVPRSGQKPAVHTGTPQSAVGLLQPLSEQGDLHVARGAEEIGRHAFLRLSPDGGRSVDALTAVQASVGVTAQVLQEIRRRVGCRNALGGLVESLPLPIDDNVTIAAGTGTSLTIFWVFT